MAQIRNTTIPADKKTDLRIRISFSRSFWGATMCVKKKALNQLVAGYFNEPTRNGLTAE